MNRQTDRNQPFINGRVNVLYVLSGRIRFLAWTIGLVLAVSLIFAVLITWAVPASAQQTEWLWAGEGNANDSKGGGHGSLQEGVLFAPGKVGQAFSFDGVNSYVYVPAGANLPHGSSPRTFAMWVYTRPTSWAVNQNTVFHYGGSGTSPNFQKGSTFGLDMDAYPNMDFYTWGNDILFNAGVPQEGWVHVAITYDGGVLRIYTQGQQRAEKPMALNTALTSLQIGGFMGSPAFGGFYFDGLIDEFRVFNRALSGPEVQNIYSGGNAPTISGFTPTSGGVGTTVTITGTNFVMSVNFLTVNLVKGVTFNGVGAKFTINSATQITATVPEGATTGPIYLTNVAGGVVTSATNFAVRPPPPTISSFTPTEGWLGSEVTITGTNLTWAAGVTFNGASAKFTVVNATTLTATVPAGATTGPIHLTKVDGGTVTSVTSATNFTVLPPPPTISRFSPSIGGAGGEIIIEGKNFVGTTAVQFGLVAAQQFTVTNYAIKATVPAGVTSGPIKVTTPNGTATSAKNFNVFQITGLRPLSGKVGTAVVITGENFVGVPKVTFNEVNSAAGLEDSGIWTAVPAGATTGRIKVTLFLNGISIGTATSPMDFTVTP
jgi:hypothetical protein